MKTKPFIIRQGDVLIERVSTIPKDLKPIQRDKGRVVLAYGEVTGHSHSISGENVEHFAAPDTNLTYFEIKKAIALLEHDEHASIQLPPGSYIVRRQREYHPQEIRRVAD